jgi:Tol biopolymer transport system component
MVTKLSVAAALFVAAAIATVVVAACQTASSAAKRYRGTIAFVRVAQDDAFNQDDPLYVIHADGSGSRRITPPGIYVSNYAWSPDAHWIAYINAGSLWLVRPDGEGRKQLLAGSASLSSSDLSWSPDGQTIAISSTGSFNSCAGKQLYLVPIDGASPRKVPGASPACDVFAWSPRGNLIAYSDTDGRGFWVVHPDGSGNRRVSSQGAGWVRWSADGNQLAFPVAVPKHRWGGIASVDADGRDFHIVTSHANNRHAAIWSPTGHRLLYGRAKDGGIYVIGANGRNNRPVTTDSSYPLAWSPDGSSIIYANSTAPIATCQCELQRLYEVGIDGRGKVQLTIPFASDFDPSWVARRS